jgi:predicted amidohydrolase YtcJ
MTEQCDLLVRAGAVITPEVLAGADAVPGFVAIRDGVIVAVGAGDDAEHGYQAARVIDLGDATLTSGLIDAHIHPVLGQQTARGLDLSGVRDHETARSRIAAYAAGHPDDDWLFGWGLDPAVFAGGAFDNTLFEGVADGRKVAIVFFDAHATLASDAALAAAGITGSEQLTDAGSIDLYPDGRPNGMLNEFSAQSILQAVQPVLTHEQILDGMEQLFRSMAESGLVGGQMLDLDDPRAPDYFDELEQRGDLAIRVRVSPWVQPGYPEGELERLAALQGRHGRRWEVRGIKFMIDGTIDNGTAWLFEPDTHGESTVSAWPDIEAYRRALQFFHERGIPTTTHAIGDAGTSFVARALGALPPNGTQHRIEHIETLPDAVLDEIVASGAAASMQPTHCTLYVKADHSDNWSQRLGDARADLAWRIGSVRERGVTVTLGSDWPVAPFDPRAILGAAQLRRTPLLTDDAPNRPEEAISARRALEGYTSQYWESVGETGGVISVGARADLSAFEHNPLTADPDVFATARVLLTVVDGEVVVDHT